MLTLKRPQLFLGLLAGRKLIPLSLKGIESCEKPICGFELTGHVLAGQRPTVGINEEESSRARDYSGVAPDPCDRMNRTGKTGGRFDATNKHGRVPQVVGRLNQDFLFDRPGTGGVADPRPRCTGFWTTASLDTPFAAALSVECCPIAPFRRPQRAFWQHLSRDDPRQHAYAGLSGPPALASRHR